MYTTHCRRYFRLGGEGEETEERYIQRERGGTKDAAAAADGAIKKAHTASASNRAGDFIIVSFSREAGEACKQAFDLT